MHIPGVNFTVTVETIGPAAATQMLARQVVGQRTLNNGRVARYADDIRNQYWEVTHQGIAFDEDGMLMDGQHRLAAIVLSDTPTPVLVFRNVPTEFFYLVDGGFSRSTQSFLTGPYTSIRAAFARFMMKLDEQKGRATGSTSSSKHPSHRVLRFLDSRQDLQDYAVEFAPAANRSLTRKAFGGTSASGLLIGGFIAGYDGKRWDRDRSQEWWDDVKAVADGEGAARSNPVRALYQVASSGNTSQCYLRSVYAAVRYRDSVPLVMIRDSNCREILVW